MAELGRENTESIRGLTTHHPRNRTLLALCLHQGAFRYQVSPGISRISKDQPHVATWTCIRAAATVLHKVD